MPGERFVISKKPEESVTVPLDSPISDTLTNGIGLLVNLSSTKPEIFKS